MKKSLRISEREFIPMESFPLKWRFVDPKHNVLPDKKLSQIKPLRSKISEKLYKEAMPFIENYYLNDKKIQQIEILDKPHDTSSTTKWLKDKMPITKEIVVCWGEDTSVVTNRDLFCKYWDNFCYPASDDVFIFPATQEWILYYFHGDQFQIGNKKKSVEK